MDIRELNIEGFILKTDDPHHKVTILKEWLELGKIKINNHTTNRMEIWDKEDLIQCFNIKVK